MIKLDDCLSQLDALTTRFDQLCVADAEESSVPSTLYHGTRERNLQFHPKKLTYLTPNKNQAAHYARGAHLGGSGTGTPTVHKIKASPGKVRNIDNKLFEAMENGEDLEETIHHHAKKAHREGARYINYSHPNAGEEGEHEVYVSLHPHKDLQIHK